MKTRDLKERIKKASAFFEPENLSNLMLKYEGEVAVLVIDVQKEFCDPAGERGNAETDAVSERIQSIIPDFRKAGIPVYAIYYSPDGDKPVECIDFHKFRPEPTDKIISKHTDSAFRSGKTKHTLRKDDKKLLLTCGFNLSACVMRTAVDAEKAGFDVCLLKDLTANDKKFDPRDAASDLEEMGGDGIHMTTSADALDGLAAVAALPHPTNINVNRKKVVHHVSAVRNLSRKVAARIRHPFRR